MDMVLARLTDIRQHHASLGLACICQVALIDPDLQSAAAESQQVRGLGSKKTLCLLAALPSVPTAMQEQSCCRERMATWEELFHVCRLRTCRVTFRRLR
jgi:hypothetical protein